MTNNDLLLIQEHIRIGKGMELTNGVPEALERLLEELKELQTVNKLLETMISKGNDKYKELEDDVDGILKTCEGMDQKVALYKKSLELACIGLTEEDCPAGYHLVNWDNKCATCDYSTEIGANCWLEYYLTKAKEALNG